MAVDTYPVFELLGRDGPARAFMREAPGGGDWVDDFANAILNEVSAAARALFVDILGAHAVTVGSGGDNGAVQLNVQWQANHGWQCEYGSTLDNAIQNLLSRLEMVQRLKEGDRNDLLLGRKKPEEPGEGGSTSGEGCGTSD